MKMTDVSHQNSSAKLDPRVASLDLSMIRKKIVAEKELGWTSNQCRSAEREYKRFLTLVFRHRDCAIVPNKIMDAFWHYHILDTEKYAVDTKAVFRKFLHHFPYFGLRGRKDREALAAAFEKTKTLYRQEFGRDMKSPIGGRNSPSSNCSRACTSSCTSSRS
jgi:hypothetical protein